MSLDPILRQSLEALGLPLVAPEPEVLQAQLSRLNCESLAGVIVGLINENEPMLKAERDGAIVTVRVIGEDATMCFTVNA